MSHTASIELFKNTTGTTPPILWPGGRGFLSAVGTGWGQLNVEHLASDGVTWLNVPAIVLTANGGVVFELPQCQIRGVANTVTNVYALVSRIPS